VRQITQAEYDALPPSFGAFLVHGDPEFDAEHDWRCFPYDSRSQDSFAEALQNATRYTTDGIDEWCDVFNREGPSRRRELVVSTRIEHLMHVGLATCNACDYGDCPFRQAADGEGD
jgi:hypothetical protein